jgi:hypothetical protein
MSITHFFWGLWGMHMACLYGEAGPRDVPAVHCLFAASFAR